jgi:integrase
MTKINRSILINGEKKWIHVQSEQEYADKIRELSGYSPKSTRGHNFRKYALEWFELFSKPGIETSTAVTYKRQLDLHIFPVLGDMDIEDVTVNDVQKIFNAIPGIRETKKKVKTVLNMIFEAAIDDEYIQRNPLNSKRLKITGADSHYTEEYTVEQMRYLIAHIPDIQKDEDRMYLALQALHPLRLEEVLGLKWGDVNFRNMTLRINRAVTHPTRNQPEIKDTKTEASARTIGLSRIAAMYLKEGESNEFIFGGEEPYSYQRVRRMCERIKRDTGFEENVTPRRFRTTVLTDIYDRTKNVKATQAAAGHTTPAMTLRYYVKGRTGMNYTADVIDEAYC